MCHYMTELQGKYNFKSNNTCNFHINVPVVFGGQYWCPGKMLTEAWHVGHNCANPYIILPEQSLKWYFLSRFYSSLVRTFSRIKRLLVLCPVCLPLVCPSLHLLITLYLCLVPLYLVIFSFLHFSFSILLQYLKFSSIF